VAGTAKQPGCVCFGSKMLFLSTDSIILVTFVSVKMRITAEKKSALDFFFKYFYDYAYEKKVQSSDLGR
jgi:hypothetical protein